MTAPITQFNVPFDELTFTRSENNLIVSDSIQDLTTYENFFNGEEPGTVATIETQDEEGGEYTEHDLLTEAIIMVNNVAQYEGYNVSLEGGAYTGYNEEVTVTYDDNMYSPTGSEETYNSVIYGNYGNDAVYGNTESDWIQGNEGNDTIFGGSAGQDILSGGDGDDIVVAGEISATGIYDVTLSDTSTVKVNLSDDNVVLSGLAGNDTIHGGRGADDISGGAGNDTLYGNAGGDSIYGGNADDGTGDSIVSGTDLIYGGDGNDLIHGGDDNDTLFGGAGNDTIYGDEGNDSIFGNTGDDVLVGGTGNDTFTFASGDGADTVQNATNTDTIIYSDVQFGNLAFSRQTNNLTISGTGNDSVTIENYFASETPLDTLFANNNTDTQTQYSIIKDARINVSGVANFQGVDIEVSEGVYEGYNENITVAYDGTKYSPTGLTQTYDSVIYGNYGNDSILGNSQDDWIQGNEGDDSIYGGAGGEDVLAGNDGDDVVVAGSINTSGKITYNSTATHISGNDGNDKLIGGSGNDTIQGGVGNDILTGNGGDNTFIFSENNFGLDTITDAANKDIFQFSVNTGTEVLPVYSGIAFSDLTFEKSGNNLIINAPDYNDGDDNITENNITVRNYFTTASSKRVDAIYALNNENVQQKYSIVENANISITLNSNESRYKGADGNETIIATNYVSPNGEKGVTITVGKGNNIITGSEYNDTVKTSSGNNNIIENNGTNKITTGAGNDTVTVNNFSNNTIKVGAGNNTVNVNSYNDNKITAGAGNDTLIVTDGFNTANLGAGNNIVNINNASTNKIVTGKGNDTFTIASGANNIKSGAGNETFIISGGYNTINSGNGTSNYTITGGELNKITTGKDTDTFTISNGINNVSAKAGDDMFNVTGGESILYGEAGDDTFNISAGSGVFDGGKGDDTYNFVNFNGLLDTDNIQISDTNGINNLILNTDDYNTGNVSIYVDVVSAKGKGKINGNWSIVNRANVNADYNGIELSGGNKSSMKLTFGANSYTVDKNALNEIAASVANWLNANDYASTSAVFEAAVNEDVAGLITVYNNASTAFFGGAA